MRETAGYMARRNLFTKGLEMERSEVISRKEAMRESAERISLNKRVSGRFLTKGVNTLIQIFYFDCRIVLPLVHETTKNRISCVDPNLGSQGNILVQEPELPQQL